MIIISIFLFLNENISCDPTFEQMRGCRICHYADLTEVIPNYKYPLKSGALPSAAVLMPAVISLPENQWCCRQI